MYPLVPFGAFTDFTPVVPAFYKNVYSPEEAIKKIIYELDKLAAYANEIAEEVNDKSDIERLDLRVSILEDALAELQEQFDAIEAGGRYRNPITGGYDYAYVVAKQMYDLLRLHAMTWKELKAKGLTWQELAANGKTNLEVDFLSNDIWGDGAEQIKYTNPGKIDVFTPGYAKEAK